MDIHFDNQAVIVTGAARGIGGGIVEGFVERGARVWACDLLEDELSALKARAKPQRGGTLGDAQGRPDAVAAGRRLRARGRTGLRRASTCWCMSRAACAARPSARSKR